MSYFDIKQNYYTDILTLIDKTISSGGSIKDVRESVVKLINEIDDLKSQI
tara:strand:- start:2583 stop:2732 length:150 start_codon:yes stop_codon:yes gene_type:complete